MDVGAGVDVVAFGRLGSRRRSSGDAEMVGDEMQSVVTRNSTVFVAGGGFCITYKRLKDYVFEFDQVVKKYKIPRRIRRRERERAFYLPRRNRSRYFGE